MNRILLSALAVAAGAGTMCAENLFTGNQEVTWENTLSIEAEKFASAAVGDELVVTIAEGATDVMELKADGQWLPGTILTRLDGKTEVKAYLTDGLQAALKKYGLELCGPSFTVQSVDLNDSDMAVPDGAVWAGFYWIDGGWNTLELYKTAFTGQNPKKLIINFSDEAEGSSFELNVLTAWDNDDMKLSLADNVSISGRQAVIDLEKLPEGRTFASYFPEGTNALMIQGHVEDGASFNITSVVVEPYEPTSAIDDVAADSGNLVDVYSIFGVKVRTAVDAQDATAGLAPGLYIVGNKKLLVK